MWVPIGKKPTPSDHESDNEISLLRLTNLIHVILIPIWNPPLSFIYFIHWFFIAIAISDQKAIAKSKGKRNEEGREKAKRV